MHIEEVDIKIFWSCDAGYADNILKQLILFLANKHIAITFFLCKAYRRGCCREKNPGYLSRKNPGKCPRMFFPWFFPRKIS